LRLREAKDYLEEDHHLIYLKVAGKDGLMYSIWNGPVLKSLVRTRIRRAGRSWLRLILV